MAKSVELRRHTDNDGDVLTGEGIAAAVAIGARLAGEYDFIVSSGAQRATQTAGCFLAALAHPVPGGIVVEPRFRSEVEDRWRAAYERAGAGDIESFRAVDPDLVEGESKLMGAALGDIFDRLNDGGRALVVGHSPMNEAAVYGLTGHISAPLGKGAGVLVSQEADSYRVEPLE
jgi:broad specificity phosphatase PhoE